MTKQPDDIVDQGDKPLINEGVDLRRRKFGTAGITSTALLLSLPSRSAMGGWGACTGSELASGNLSREGTTNPCGCSPGFWWNKNGSALWTSSIDSPLSTDLFNVYFGVHFLDPDQTMANLGPGASWTLWSKPAGFYDAGYHPSHSIPMHAIASVLNAAFYGSRYPLYSTPDAAKNAFYNAAQDSTGAALQTWLTHVDIYGSSSYPNLWCYGKEE